MKRKTALKQSTRALWADAILALAMAVLATRWPSGYTLVPLVLVLGFGLLEAHNIYRINRDAARDPSSLEKRV
jgi:hypothetical protein